MEGERRLERTEESVGQRICLVLLKTNEKKKKSANANQCYIFALAMINENPDLCISTVSRFVSLLICASCVCVCVCVRACVRVCVCVCVCVSGE